MISLVLTYLSDKPASLLLDKQVHAALFGFRQVRRHAGELIDAVDQRVLGDAHEPHRRRTSDEPHAKVEGRLHQLRHPGHPILLHHRLHHLRSQPAEVKSGQRKRIGAAFVEQSEHPSQPVFSRTRGASSSNGIQSPERKKYGDVHPHRRSARGDDKSRHRSVEIPTQ